MTAQLVTPEVLQKFPKLQAGVVNIYVISSLCGGTGAGLFVDIAYELRYLQQQAQLPGRTQIKGLFALGDVYDFASKRVLANTYESLRELNWIQRADAIFELDYPDGSRRKINGPAFDTVYLFSNSNASDIQFSSPSEDFAHLCAEFIFLDSGADTQANGDSLSVTLQANRNNAEVYTRNCDEDGIPHGYSALGLCKIRFPAERVAQLCAAWLASEIIEYHFMGRGKLWVPGDTQREALEFLTNDTFLYNDNGNDLASCLFPDPLDSWVTTSLTTAHNKDVLKIKTLKVEKLTTTTQIIRTRIGVTQTTSPAKIIAVLYDFKMKLQKMLKTMQEENRGAQFIASFLEEAYKLCRASRDFAQQRRNEIATQEEPLATKEQLCITKIGILPGRIFGIFFRKSVRLEQLNTTYQAIRVYSLNRIDNLKMQAVLSFYEGVYDAQQNLSEGGTGALSILTTLCDDFKKLQESATRRAKFFKGAYEAKRRIVGSLLEILIYDNEKFSTLNEIYEAVFTPALRNGLFNEILQQVGGHHQFSEIKDEPLQTIFMEKCIVPFRQEIDKKTVAQRIYEAKRHLTNSIDYYPRLYTVCDLANYFCRLDRNTTRLANLHELNQSVMCVVAFIDTSDPAWEEIQTVLTAAMNVAGRQIPFSHTNDRHSILVYREFCGFPAYTLQRIDSYRSSYDAENGTLPLQMLTKESSSVHIQKPVVPQNHPTGT